MHKAHNRMCANKKLIISVFNLNAHQLERALRAGATGHRIRLKGQSNPLTFLCTKKYKNKEEENTVFACIKLLLQYGAPIELEHLKATLSHPSYGNRPNHELFKLFFFMGNIPNKMYLQLCDTAKNTLFILHMTQKLQSQIHYEKLRRSYQNSGLTNAITYPLITISENKPYIVLPFTQEDLEQLGWAEVSKPNKITMEMNTELD